MPQRGRATTKVSLPRAINLSTVGMAKDERGTADEPVSRICRFGLSEE